MTNPVVLVLHWLPDGTLSRWVHEFPQFEFVDARAPGVFVQHAGQAVITYGLPDLNVLPDMSSLRWIQLASAGVPLALCAAAKERGILVTNLAGLYGPTIAEHALGMMLMLRRNLHLAHINQMRREWERSVAQTMHNLHGSTLAIVGLGNIGQHIARLARAFGMRVVGCRRRPQFTPWVDQVSGPGELRTMLAEAHVVAVAAPLTAATEGLLGGAEFQAMRPGAVYINVSRGPIAQEPALLAALRSGHLAGAGLDVFAVEPLAQDHPFWTMANVLVSPHYSGETINNGAKPGRRFVRNLHNWLAQTPLEGTVDLDHGY